MNPNKRLARLAGVLYLITGGLVAFSHLHVRTSLIAWNDPAATFNNIKASEDLFRLSIVGDIISMILFLLVPLILFRILKQVNKNQAWLMAILAVIGIVITSSNTVNMISALRLIVDSTYSEIFDTNQLHGQVILLLDMHSYGFLIAHVFFGLWLLPLGLLVYKSGFIPKILGALLIVAMAGYMIEFFTDMLFPVYMASISDLTAAMQGLGELPFIFWLIIVGVKEK